jgi:hypothetical protein
LKKICWSLEIYRVLIVLNCLSKCVIWNCNKLIRTL